ncbi:hypothetical protein BMS3Bbin10_02495 [bacterium BMS3Bbin10]|nr:hypothetical protein BMS3Bbin10_02495 [bacterium BMS3Bbin10]
MKIIGVLGIGRCAEVVDKSTSLIRKWSDPDNCTLPSLAQALALDLEYVREKHCTPPLFHVYASTIEKELNAVDEGEHVLVAILTLQAAVCDLGKKIASELIHPEKIMDKRGESWQEMHETVDLVMQDVRDLEVAIKLWQRTFAQDDLES